MARTTDEWIGATDETRAPPRVRTRVFDRHNGCCYLCGLKIDGKKWALDHEKALINGGENREANLRPVHIKCHAVKTAADVKEKAKVAKVRGKYIGAIRPKQTIPKRPFPATEKSIKRQARPSLPPRQLFGAIS